MASKIKPDKEIIQMYTDLDTIKKRFPEENIKQLTDDDGTEDIVDAVVTEMITAADGEINALLSGRYTVPLALPYPAIIVSSSTEIAIYLLHQRYVDEIPETWKDAYKRRIKYLEAVAKGKIDLPITETGAADFSSSVEVSSHFDN